MDSNIAAQTPTHARSVSARRALANRPADAESMYGVTRAITGEPALSVIGIGRC